VSSSSDEEDGTVFEQAASCASDSMASKEDAFTDQISNGDWVAVGLSSESNKTKKVYLGKVCK
jgi:predicted Mrr-cat superfamily restriction endonuclease